MVKRGVFAAQTMWHHFMNDSLYRNSIFLIFNTAFLSFAGFIFWFIAARMYDTHTVGLASTLISSATLIATLGYLGFDFALIRFMAKKDAHKHHYLSSALTLAVAISLFLAICYIMASPLFSHELTLLLTPVNAATFILLVIGTNWNTLTNTAFVANRLSKYILYASLLFIFVRMVLEIILIKFNMGLIVAQTFGVLANVIASLVFLARHDNYMFKPRIHRQAVMGMMKYSAQAYASNMINNVAPLLLPIIIISILSPSQSAYYYIVTMIVSMLNILPQAISQSLFAEGSHSLSEVQHQFKKARKTMIMALTPIILIILIGGYPALLAFGEDYATGGYMLLVSMCIAVIPKMFNYLYATQLRIVDKISTIIFASAINCIVMIGVSMLLMYMTKNLVYVGVAALMGEFAALILYRFSRRTTKLIQK